LWQLRRKSREFQVFPDQNCQLAALICIRNICTLAPVCILPEVLPPSLEIGTRKTHITSITKDLIMTQSSGRLLDEIAKLATDAAGVAQGVRREAETAVKSQFERMLSDMDLVQREEFEAVREMAAKARDENEALRSDLEALRSELAAFKTAKRTTSRKPAVKKSD
jgi:BMFP domain-containing protein YqiC